MEYFPWEAGHYLSGISTAYADRQSAQTTAVWRMRVGPDNQAARERVILQHNLVDDACTRLPESDHVLLRSRREEVVDFLVLVHRAQKIFVRPHLGADQVIAVDGARYGDLFLARLHELQHGHLRRCV